MDLQAEQIINFDFPRFLSDYLHRIGRTGRIGSSKRCTVTNFIMRPDEIELSQKIEYSIRKNQQLPNINANITRIKTVRREKYERNMEYIDHGIEQE